MTKEEIMKLLNIYEQNGVEELINYLNELKYTEDVKELDKLLRAYMHLTNRKNNSLYYTSEEEQIVTNHSSSIIYFNKKLFDFKNINYGMIVVKNSLEVDKEEMKYIFDNAEMLFGKQSSKIKDTRICNSTIEFLGNSEYRKFDYEECKLIRELLVTPTFKLSDKEDILYASGNNGCAYIFGEESKNKFKSLKVK